VNRAPVIDVSALPNLVQGSRAPMWWGMVLLLVIESAVFGTIITSYFYLRMGQPEWPPAGISPPELGLATLNTFVLLASSIPMYMADHASTTGDQRKLRLGMIGAISLGLLFLLLKYLEYRDVPYRWDEHAYGSIVWLTIGFHSAHVASVVLKTIYMFYLALRGYFNTRRNLGVQVNGLYWHFVVAVWVPLYIVLYWAPRFME
jgi:cytochrome c oxidase subunit III